MDSVAQLPDGERELLFRETGARMGVEPWIAEKDFWVCWVLAHLFSLPGSHPLFVFKGGTSLSKVFDAIHRFSEDIDITIDRTALGFDGDRDPRRATGKRRRRLLDELDEERDRYVARELRPALEDRFSQTLHESSWTLESAQDDAGQDTEMTLVFAYPPASRPRNASYARQAVKLEFGARGDVAPAADHLVGPYARDWFPDYFSEGTAAVRVLDPRRTFWEKITILHSFAFGGEDHVGDRKSRHYYDVFRLCEGPIGEEALDDLAMLEAVADFKTTFFYARWARYDLARPGSLVLVPDDGAARKLRSDYEEMIRSGYFYGPEPPSFEEILQAMEELERRING